MLRDKYGSINATKFNAFQKVKVMNVEVSHCCCCFFVNDLHDFMWAHQLSRVFTHFFSLLLSIFFVLLVLSKLLCAISFVTTLTNIAISAVFFCAARYSVWTITIFTGDDCAFKHNQIKIFLWLPFFVYLLFCVCVYVSLSLSVRFSLFVWVRVCVWAACHFLIAHISFLHYCSKKNIFPNKIVSVERFQKFNWIPWYRIICTSTVKAVEFSSASQEIPPKSVYLYVYIYYGSMRRIFFFFVPSKRRVVHYLFSYFSLLCVSVCARWLKVWI